MVIAGTVLTCCPAAYAFAYYDVRHKDLIFGVLLSTLMLPAQVTVVPLFQAFAALHWVNTYLPLVLPAWLGGNVFGIFLLRQFFMQIAQVMGLAFPGLIFTTSYTVGFERQASGLATALPPAACWCAAAARESAWPPTKCVAYVQPCAMTRLQRATAASTAWASR